MEKDEEKMLKNLLAKLRQPLHINFISSHILKKDIHETREYLQNLIKDSKVVESAGNKDYFVIKN
ncbi:MAG: hypothetical protein RL728_1010 [Bacteroidota bacterium]|jgi:hypothetical protein